MKDRFKIFVIVTLLTAGGTIFSQNKKLIDSLSRMMESAKADTTKINYMLDLGWELKQIDPVETKNLLNDAKRLATNQP